MARRTSWEKGVKAIYARDHFSHLEKDGFAKLWIMWKSRALISWSDERKNQMRWCIVTGLCAENFGMMKFIFGKPCSSERHFSGFKTKIDVLGFVLEKLWVWPLEPGVDSCVNKRTDMFRDWLNALVCLPIKQRSEHKNMWCWCVFLKKVIKLFS